MLVGLAEIEPVELSRPVFGVPYTAEAVTETEQLRPDGNRAKRRMSASIARDSRGRVRREHGSLVIGPLVAERAVPLVTISDPAAGTQLLLDPDRKTAMWMPVPPAGDRPPGADRLRRPREPDQASARTTPLGFRNIDGIATEGTRTTFTIEGRGDGSRVEVVSERWHSRDLQVVVMTRRSDPRFGETVYRLTNVSYAEPSPDLFEVPAGFTVQDRPARPRVRPR
jgi:hypothetical protein